MGRLGWILAALGGAAAVGGIAYLATGGAAKAATPVYSGGGTLDVVLSPGTMTAIGLSLTGDNGVSFTLPTGATGGINLISTDSTVVSATSAPVKPPATATALKVGTATLTATYTDASGTWQQSTIPVTVTA